MFGDLKLLTEAEFYSNLNFSNLIISPVIYSYTHGLLSLSFRFGSIMKNALLVCRYFGLSVAPIRPTLCDKASKKNYYRESIHLTCYPSSKTLHDCIFEMKRGEIILCSFTCEKDNKKFTGK